MIRTTPAQYEVGGQFYRHWFDGLAMLHSFAFQDGRVSYRNRLLESKARRETSESGKIEYGEFATDPCQMLFKRLKTAFWKPAIGGNGNVKVSRFGDEYVALTETPLAMTFDPQTLETLGSYNYEQTDAQISSPAAVRAALVPIKLFNFVKMLCVATPSVGRFGLPGSEFSSRLNLSVWG